MDGFKTPDQPIKRSGPPPVLKNRRKSNIAPRRLFENIVEPQAKKRASTNSISPMAPQKKKFKTIHLLL